MAIVVRKDFGNEGVNFLTGPENSFQVGVLKHKEGHEIRSHAHKKILKKNRENQEFLFVISGEVETTVYDGKKVVIKTVLRGGDAMLQLGGGHGFKILVPTKMIEVKQGPYRGVEDEKEYIEE